MYQLRKDTGVDSAVLLRSMARERDIKLRLKYRVYRVLGLEL